MTAEQIEKLALFSIALLLALGAWIVIEHPEWIYAILRYRG